MERAPRGAGTELCTAADEAARLAGPDSSDWSTAAGDAARSLPKIQTGAMPPLGWHHSWAVRPGYVYFGEGAGYAAPRLKSIHWVVLRAGRCPGCRPLVG
jgi:hypothetical protein